MKHVHGKDRLEKISRLNCISFSILRMSCSYIQENSLYPQRKNSMNIIVNIVECYQHVVKHAR